MKKRWLLIGLLALGIFVINVIARVITKQFDIADENDQITVGLIGIVAVGVVLIAAAVWWAVRYPFSRLVFDIGAAVILGALLSLILGPFAGGSKPFVEGLGNFVGQFLMFLGIAAVGVMLGFLGVVTLGRDWKSRGLRTYERNYRSRPHRAVRG
jgi:hypothetical protein